MANSTGLLAKIFTPLGFAITAAAAAVVGFGVSAAKGADEASQLNKALVLTGNYAGTTSEDLQTMAASMRTFGTTQHQASEALAEVAKSGTFTASQIGLVGQAALDMSRSTGQSINETIKQFQSLQDEPVKAVLKLNESQHFLTTAIYDQIKALEDQGHAQDAANLAMQTYARTVADRTSQIHDNLGIIQKSWEGIKGATNAAIDAAMNWGRQLTGQAQFNDIFEKRQKLLAQQASGVTIIAAQDAKGGFAGIIPIQQQIDAYTKQLGQLQDARVAAQKAANQTQLQSEAV